MQSTGTNKMYAMDTLTFTWLGFLQVRETSYAIISFSSSLASTTAMLVYLFKNYSLLLLCLFFS